MSKEIIIQRFDGGIADDNRQQTINSFTITKHFDIYSNPFRLTPYRSTEADTDDGSTSTGMKQYDVRHFQLSTISGKLYGLGRQSAVDRPKIVSKADPTSGAWTLEATAEGGATRILGCFIEWQGAFWMFSGTTNVSKWVIGSTFTDTVATVGTITHAAQGVIATDNNLYIFYNNKVVRVSAAGTVTDAVLTLPSDGRITSATMFGDYMAIGWASGTTLSSGGRSKLYIWNLSATDVTDSVDMGEGQLMVLGNIEGKIIGISDFFISSAFGILNGSVVIRMYGGGTPTVLKELKTNQTGAIGRFIRDVVIKANKMYFVAALPFNGSTSSESTFNVGIYSFGRKNINSELALTLDYVEEGLSASNFRINSFGNAGNYWFINHSADGSITKTDDAANYTFTSIYESLRFNGGDSNFKKKLLGVSVSTVALPAAGQVVLKYKKDAETSFTTISTNTTDNSVYQEEVNIRGTGSNFPEFNEIVFRIESTGGAEITGLKFVHDDAKNLLKTRAY